MKLSTQHKVITIIVLAAFLLLFFLSFFSNNPIASAKNESGGSIQFLKNIPAKTFYTLTLWPVKIFSISSNKIQNFLNLIIYINDLKKENSQLYFETKKLISENTKLKEFKKENEILRKALDLEKNKEYDLMPARIIGTDPAVFGNAILIDKGIDVGIDKDMTVLSPGGALLGKIKKSRSNHSYIDLIQASGNSINVIAQDSRVDGILKGEYGLSLTLEFIPQDKEINVGEIIITSGINDRFQQGIIIGRIKSINNEPRQPFKRAVVEPEDNINNLEWAYVIIN